MEISCYCPFEKQRKRDEKEMKYTERIRERKVHLHRTLTLDSRFDVAGLYLL